MFRLACTLALSAILPAAMAAQTSTGQAPPAGFGARDMFADLHLPPLADHAGDALWAGAQKLQVLARARKLGLDERSAVTAWRQGEAAYAEAKARVEQPAAADPLLFDGKSASALNQLLARHPSRPIRVASGELSMDAPLVIGGKGVDLDLGSARLVLKPGAPYGIRIENADNVRLSGGLLTGAGWGVLVAGSRHVELLHMTLDSLTGGGVVVTGSDHVTIWGSQFHRLSAAPVMLHGNTHQSVVAANEITDNIGASNWHAGVVLSDRNADLRQDPTSLLNPDKFGVKEQPIPTRLEVPEDNVIALNHIAANLTSGIYSDGSVRNLIAENRIESNSKEGMCLDNGSAANVVAYNFFQGNGKRWGKSDRELQQDFVANFGRLPDGSSPAKVPAISIDNAAYNQILFNEINRNYGGGIKMVRTAYYNLIGLNTLSDNNEGQNKQFHFFGIELGAATADTPVPDLDFTPARGHEIFSNLIRGTHYAGGFFAEGSDRNVLFDNTIFGATNWAMESVHRQPNTTFNNLTNLKSRNVGTGLDPNLIPLSKGEFDPH